MEKEEIRKIGEDRMKRLQASLDEGTPFIEEYNGMIDLERQEMNKILNQNTEE